MIQKDNKKHSNNIANLQIDQNSKLITLEKKIEDQDSISYSKDNTRIEIIISMLSNSR